MENSDENKPKPYTVHIDEIRAQVGREEDALKMPWARFEEISDAKERGEELELSEEEAAQYDAAEAQLQKKFQENRAALAKPFEPQLKKIGESLGRKGREALASQIDSLKEQQRRVDSAPAFNSPMMYPAQDPSFLKDAEEVWEQKRARDEAESDLRRQQTEALVGLHTLAEDEKAAREGAKDVQRLWNGAILLVAVLTLLATILSLFN